MSARRSVHVDGVMAQSDYYRRAPVCVVHKVETHMPAVRFRKLLRWPAVGSVVLAELLVASVSDRRTNNTLETRTQARACLNRDG